MCDTALGIALTRARKLALSVSSGGSVDVFAIARLLGVERIEPAAMPADGHLAIQPTGGFVIRYRGDNGHKRNRFTVAHEAGHLLLAEAQGRELSRNRREEGSSRTEELAVNRIAAELLMPEDSVVRFVARWDADGKRPGWRAVSAMRRLFDVSESAAALRVLEIGGLDAVLFRVNLEGAATRYPYDRSAHGGVSIVGNGAEIASRLWTEAMQSNRHTVAVHRDGRKSSIRCEGLVRCLRGRGATWKQYWVLGWEVRGKSDPVCP